LCEIIISEKLLKIRYNVNEEKLMNKNIHVVDIVNFKIFDKETCEKIINTYRDSSNWILTKIGRHSEIIRDQSVRKSSIIDLSSDEGFMTGFMSDMSAAINQANVQFWNFDISERMEVQIMKYVPGDHYGSWHMDVGNTATTSTRKVTFTIQLSDPNDYSGGDLIISSMEGNPEIRNQGSATAFPSFVSHCVSKIDTGTRYCLVGWIHGPPFR
jgi:PKHD-type hydroxylase